MSYDDPDVRPLLDLEGLKEWRPGRTRATRRSSAPSTASASTAATARSSPDGVTRLTGLPVVDLGDLGLDGGAHLLVKLRARRRRRRVRRSRCAARTPTSLGQLGAWCRAQGHRVPRPRRAPPAASAVGLGARRARPPARSRARGPPRCRGARRRRRRPAGALGPRGARRAGRGRRARRRASRSHDATTSGPTAPRLYAQAAAAQWDPATAIDWDAPLDQPGGDRGRRRPGDDVPRREREGGAGRAGALPRPGPPPLPRGAAAARGQVADEARHIEVFTRRAHARRRPSSALSTAAGRASLQTLLDEPDFATRLVPALGARRGHLPVAARVPRAPRPRRRSPAGSPTSPRQDEARHVAFGARPPRAPRRARARLCDRAWPRAVERRHDALRTPPGSTTRSSTRSCCSPPAPGRPAAIAAGLARPSRSCSATWTTAGGPASRASASPPARPRPCPRCTRATSCERRRLRRSGRPVSSLPGVIE